MQKLRRYEELDSLRGLAALTVVIWHFLSVLPVFWDTKGLSGPLWIGLLKNTPLRILIAGHEAVIFFFLLSGFVLTLPFLAGKSSGYPTFLLKRICRIYIPYAVAIAVSLVLYLMFADNRVGTLSDGASAWWGLPVTWELVVQHFLLIGNFDTRVLDTVIWSLVHEMRISIILPFMIFVIIRYSWKVNLGLGLLLSFAGIGLHYVIGSWGDTVFYMLMFMCGALLAKYKTPLIERYSLLSGTVKFGLFGLAVLLYCFSRVPSWILPSVDFHAKGFINDYFITIGASLFIIMALSGGWLSAFLRNSVCLFLGKISYSLYLYHVPVLLAVIHLLDGVLPLPLTLVLAFVVTILASTLAWRLVEKPSMTLSQRLSKRPKATPQATSSNLNQ